MPLSNNMLSYTDIQLVADRALESEIGLQITFTSKGEVINFRQRFYKFRSLANKASMTAWDQDDPRYGSSIYDTLAVIIKEKKEDRPWALELRRREKRQFDVRELKV